MKKRMKIGISVLIIISIVTTALLIVFLPNGANRNNDGNDWNWEFPLSIEDYPTAPTDIEWSAVEPGNIPIANPLKGFMPYYGDYSLFPYRMEYTYVPVNEVVGSSPNDIDFTYIEDVLDDVATRGNQLVFRLFFDYPAEINAVPQYLIDDGLEMTPYTAFGGGYNPDYDDARMVALMKNLIAELGETYDGDPRVGFIQIGLLGHWGEWHTYPDEEQFANTTTQTTVLQSFDDAFNKTKVLVRYPDTISAPFNLGYHDDSFAYETLGPNSWEFYPRLQSSGTTARWQNEPIGGEVRPEVQIEAFSADLGSSQNISECIDVTHASWMLETAAFVDEYDRDSMSDTEREQAAYISSLLGYTLAACYYNVTFDEGNDKLTLKVFVENFGCAPFYYNWSVQFGILDDSDQVLHFEMTNNTIDGILPDSYEIWNHTWNSISNYGSTDQLALKIPNPMNGGDPVILANNQINDEGWLKIIQLDNII